MSLITQPLTLPCGVTLKNRLAKAAMTEGLSTPAGHSTPELARLYNVWAESGCGLLITGNVQIDGNHLERPGNVILDATNRVDNNAKEALKQLSEATKDSVHLWIQLSHAGRQTQNNVNKQPKGPSAVAMNIPGGKFNKPVALTVAEIESIQDGFVQAAKACRDAGFTGVQIHSAHGYLLSQFLSPRANIRDDKYGGSLENRARLLLDIVKAVRSELGPKFPIAVKLNSADFQRGGFSFEESLKVAGWLQTAGIDLLEISGGNYEQTAFIGADGLLEKVEEQPGVTPKQKSTKDREAYFLDFAEAMRKTVSIPLMVTGGFRAKKVMEAALASKNVDILGIGRPLCYAPYCVQEMIDGKIVELPRRENELSLFPWFLAFLRRFKVFLALEVFAKQFWYYTQFVKMGETGAPDLSLSVFGCLIKIELSARRWLSERRKLKAESKKTK